MWRECDSLCCSHRNVPQEKIQLLLNYLPSLWNGFSIWTWFSIFTRWWWYRNCFSTIFKNTLLVVKDVWWSFQKIVLCSATMKPIFIGLCQQTNVSVCDKAWDWLTSWTSRKAFTWERGNLFSTRLSRLTLQGNQSKLWGRRSQGPYTQCLVLT